MKHPTKTQPLPPPSGEGPSAAQGPDQSGVRTGSQSAPQSDPLAATEAATHASSESGAASDPTQPSPAFGETQPALSAPPDTLEDPPAPTSQTLPLPPSTHHAGGAEGPSTSSRPFGPYTRFEALAAQGAMGMVVRAYHAAIDRWELVKFLRPELAQSGEHLAQFQREGRALAKLSHPNVVQVFATYQPAGQLALAMEFLEGEDLERTLERRKGKPLGVELCSHLLLGAARGLAALHDIGLLHRDIKPANLFVLPAKDDAFPRIKLIDLGLASAAERGSLSRSDPSLVAQKAGGTPLFLAPEMWLGAPASPATDVFALGVSFYVALAGEYPLTASSPGALARKWNAGERPRPIAQLRPDLPRHLSALIDKLLSTRASERPRDGRAVAREVAHFVQLQRLLPKFAEGRCPFPGLAPFDGDRAGTFFGREGAIADLAEGLRRRSLNVVVAPPKAGVTSLVGAGLTRAQDAGLLSQEHPLELLPVPVGPGLLQGLAQAMASSGLGSSGDLLGALRERPAELPRELAAKLQPDHKCLVLWLDDIQRLWSPSTPAAEVRSLGVFLEALSHQPAKLLRVVLSGQDSALNQLAHWGSIGPRLLANAITLAPITPGAICGVFQGIAAAWKRPLDTPEGLAEVVVALHPSEPSLPLWANFFIEWWERIGSSEGPLPLAELRSLPPPLTGFGKSLENQFQGLSEPRQRQCERLLFQVVDRHRRSAPRLKMPHAAQRPEGDGDVAVLEQLLRMGAVKRIGDTLALLHPKLPEVWPRLGALASVGERDRQILRLLQEATEDWHQGSAVDLRRWGRPSVPELQRWVGQTPVPLGAAELEYLRALQAAWSASRARRWLAGGLALGLAGLGASLGLSAHVQLKDEHRAQAQALASARAKSATLERRSWVAQAKLQAAAQPAKALRLLELANGARQDLALDPLGWQVRARGLSTPLVTEPSRRFTGLKFSLAGRWLALAAGPRVVLLPRARGGAKQLALGGGPKERVSDASFDALGDALAVFTTTGRLLAGKAPSFRLREVARCRGRASFQATGDEIYFACGRTGGEGGFKLWRGSFGDAALSPWRPAGMEKPLREATQWQWSPHQAAGEGQKKRRAPTGCMWTKKRVYRTSDAPAQPGPSIPAAPPSEHRTANAVARGATLEACAEVSESGGVRIWQASDFRGKSNKSAASAPKSPQPLPLPGFKPGAAAQLRALPHKAGLLVTQADRGWLVKNPGAAWRVTSLPAASSAAGWSWSPSQQALWTVGQSARLVDPLSGKLLANYPLPFRWSWAQEDPRGLWLVGGDNQGRVAALSLPEALSRLRHSFPPNASPTFAFGARAAALVHEGTLSWPLPPAHAVPKLGAEANQWLKSARDAELRVSSDARHWLLFAPREEQVFVDGAALAGVRATSSAGFSAAGARVWALLTGRREVAAKALKPNSPLQRTPLTQAAHLIVPFPRGQGWLAALKEGEVVWATEAGNVEQLQLPAKLQPTLTKPHLRWLQATQDWIFWATADEVFGSSTTGKGQLQRCKTGANRCAGVLSRKRALVVVSADGGLHLWDTAHGQWFSLPPLGRRVRQCGVSPEGVLWFTDRANRLFERRFDDSPLGIRQPGDDAPKPRRLSEWRGLPITKLGFELGESASGTRHP